MVDPIPGASDIENALAGLRGDVHLTYRYEQRTKTYAFEADLTNAIRAASIELDNTRPVVRIAKFTIDPSMMPVGFDPAADHIAPIAMLDVPMYVPGVAGVAPHWVNPTVDIPLGLFHLDAPESTYTENDSEWQVDASDVSVLLLTAKTPVPYRVAAAANYITEVVTIFNALGLLNAFPANAAVTPVEFVWAPGTSFGQIANDLLFGINFYPAWANGVGVFTSRERIDPSTEPPVWEPTTAAAPRLIVSPWKTLQDTTRYANRETFVIDDPRRTAQYVVKVNNDPTSPISVASLGVTNPDPAGSAGRVVDIGTVEDIADFELRTRAAQALKGTLASYLDPRRGPHEFYALTIDTIENGTLWQVFGWAMPLATGQTMVHVLGEALPVETSIVIAVSGTTQTATEAQIVTGGRTIILTMPTGYTWVAAGATFDAQRAGIIAGLVSAGTEAHGWNIAVVPAMVVANVVRTSGTVVTITLPAVASYSITLPETITVEVPESAVTGAYANVTDPTFTITPS